MTLALPFDNSYSRLPSRFFARQAPVPVAEPRLLALNAGLAARLGLDAGALAGPEGVAMLAGNLVPGGAEPLAQAYAGHQFGGWVPQLGDGRAVLLGEIVAPDGARFDLQLKGAGVTPFSRRGDGRAWIGPVLREYLVSEAMAAMGVPTTRALAATATGESVQRETALPGAVLARVAASHIRVGTFQYFAAREDTEALEALSRHVIDRHYPGVDGAEGLLGAVITAQAGLIARWMGLGFIHGVMNTDNMAVSGETIDYGPCAFLDTYDPQKVFSSIDQRGRYAYGNQPQVAIWNLGQFASCLLPLMGEETAAIARATELVNGFAGIYEAEWLRVFAAKLGIAAPVTEDRALIEALLGEMAGQQADFTATFRGLADDKARDEFADRAGFDLWAARWRDRLGDAPGTEALIRANNPAVIPRNHRIEAAIQAAVRDDLAPFERLGRALAAPFADDPEFDDLRRAPSDGEEVRRTFCGT